jgi:SAM-dependent methyltransferase
MVFDEYADRYDAWFLENPNVLGSEVLLVKAALGMPGRTLSVGCGSGLFEWILAREHDLVIGDGVEPSDGMAEIARKRGLDVKRGSAEGIPHDDAVFDTVLMNGVSAYVSDLGRAFAEAFRVLKPGGALVVADVPAYRAWIEAYTSDGMRSMAEWLERRLDRLAAESAPATRARRLDLYRTSAELERAFFSMAWELT